VIVLSSVAVATVGCSHDTLGSGTQELAVVFSPDPSGAGRFERGTMDIQALQALPDDPATAVIFEDDTMIFRFDTFIADLVSPNAVAYSKIALAAGTYKITRFKITPPSMVDTNVPPNPATCIEGVAAVDRSAPGVPPSFEFLDAPEFDFTVRPGQTTLAIKVNMPDLIAGYESAFTCQLGCGPGGGPCLTGFNIPAFRAAVLANVTFE
jgi:hypothetical protein